MEQNISHNDIHKAVRNVMFNELGLDRAGIERMVHQEVEQVTEKVLERHLLSSGWFSNMVTSVISRMLTKGVRSPSSLYDQTTKTFDQYVVEQVNRHIREMVTSKFNIRIEEK